MFRFAPPARAALLLAVSIMTTLAACGGGTKGPSPALSPLASSPGAATGKRVVDLATTEPAFSLETQVQDLASGSGNVATGDFNGDGEPDLLVGAPQADGPRGSRVDAGEAYVFFGPLEGTRQAKDADVTIYGALPGDSLGFAVLAGDLNGDKTDDVIVGAPGVTAGFDPRSDQGRVYVFYGGRNLEKVDELDLAGDVYDFTLTGAEGFSRAGNALARGDINGDGKADLIVGAPFAGRKPGTPPGGERTTVGEVYVIFGGKQLSGELNVAATAPDLVLAGPEALGQFGSAVAAGDVNDDGVDDVIVSAHRSGASLGRAEAGAVYIFFGGKRATGKISVQEGGQSATILGPAPSAGFGFPLTAMDFNGDGADDIAAGGRSDGPAGRLTLGSVRIIFGGKDLAAEIDLAQTPADVMLQASSPVELLPSSLAAGDADGDGAGDLAIGSALAEGDGRMGAGKAYVVPGAKDLAAELDITSAAQTVVIGAEADERLGSAVAIGAGPGRKPSLFVTAPGGGPGTKGGNVYIVPLRTP